MKKEKLKTKPLGKFNHSENNDRAKRGYAAVVVVAGLPPDEADLRDTLTNLMHYAHREGIEFENELRIARKNFEAEA